MIFKDKFYFGFFTVLIGMSADVGAQVSYAKQNVINNGGFDDSLFLGGRNVARTSDVEVGDINRDGFPDIIDNNSRNFSNFTDFIIRINSGDGSGFTAVPIPSAGELVSLDSHLADLNNDGYDDLIRSQFGISVYINERASPWFSLANSDFRVATDTCVSNIEVADVNNDGFLDIGIAQSILFPCEDVFTTTSQADILLNDGTGRFTRSIPPFVAQPNVSSHDIFFLDANHDTYQDVVVVNENGDSFLYLSDGAEIPNFVVTDLVLPAGISGNAMDLNADGLVDFVIGGEVSTSVYLNNLVSPGTFTKITELPNITTGDVFELELADFDNDGDVDILSSNNFGGDPVLWVNNGDALPAFTETVNPFNADFIIAGERVEVFDFDLDGDQDIYIAGGDFFTGFLGCRGCVLNLFFEAETLPQQLYTNFELDTGVWFQSTEDTDDWRFRWDQTSSFDTGPDRASLGTFYYYLETTVGAASDAGDTAILESPPLTFGSNRYVVFDYHMYGSDIGSLHVDVFDGVQWVDSVWSVSGQQQLDETNPWLTARVNLSEFDGEIRVRIRAEAIGGFRGDIAIDNLNVTNEPFAALESVDTTIAVELPFDEFLIGGNLFARVDDEEFFMCNLSDIDEDGEVCTITLSTAPGASVELFVDPVILVEIEGIFLNNTWFGCDERVGESCLLDANGMTRNLELFQGIRFGN